MKIDILHEDNHLLIINKSPGIPVQRDRSNEVSYTEICKEYIKKKYNKPGNVFLGPVHRLDKFVSGILVFARTSKAASRLHGEFLSKRIKKFYVTLLEGDEGNGEGWIELNDHISYRDGYGQIGRGDNSKEANLRMHHVSTGEDSSLYLIDLITGRKHQIRIQLSSRGRPVVGDRKYGSGVVMGRNSICLHSFFTEFIHPVKKEPLKIYAEIPEYFSRRITVDDDLRERLESLIEV